MKKKILLFAVIILSLIMITSCSTISGLFGPTVRGDNEVEKAISGAKQIKESDKPKEKLVELFNEKYVAAYNETSEAIKSAKEDISKYLDMPFKDYAKLADLYSNIKTKAAGINTQLDYPSLVKDLNVTASKDLYAKALTLDKSTEDTDQIDLYKGYIYKAIEMNPEYEEEGTKTIIEYNILAGDIKVQSDDNDDLIEAVAYYSNAYDADKENMVAKDKLQKAFEKQFELKLKKINDLINNGTSYSDYYEAKRIFETLYQGEQEAYSDLLDVIEEKRTAKVLVCVMAKDRVQLPETKTFNPQWENNDDIKNNPAKLVVDFVNIQNMYFNIPDKYNFVLIPDAEFGRTEYDYDTTESGNITVDSTENAVQKSLYETALAQDPYDMEAQQALETGTYREATTIVSRSINDVYHIYKMENGNKTEIDTTPSTYSEVELTSVQYISGSKYPIELKTGASFTNGDFWGEKFSYSEIENYFSQKTIDDLYNYYFNHLDEYFSLFK